MDSKAEMVAIGARLKAARQRASVTQEGASKVTNVSRSTVSNWEAGRNMPCLVQFKSLLGLYGVTGHEILFGRHPLELTTEQTRELMQFAQLLSPGLQMRLDLLMTIIGGRPLSEMQ
jgi:transcriptional regulator with XRE-family HTH domain